MKKIFIFLPIFFLILNFDVLSQTSSVVITPKKVNYARKGVERHRRFVSIRYPILSGALKPAVKTKLDNSISYWRNFETTLKESLSETWLSSLDYEVNYNKNGILHITLIMEGVGAYPSTSLANLVINLKTGERVKFTDIFKQDSLAKLAEMTDKKLQEEKREIYERIDEGDESQEDKKYLKEEVEKLKFTIEDLDEFSVSDKGVTILYDAGFRHAIQALQPEGRYLFSYNELQPFIKSESILNQFIR